MNHQSFYQQLYRSHQDCPACPAPSEVSKFYADLLGAMFPDFIQLAHLSEQEFFQFMEALKRELERLLNRISSQANVDPEKVTNRFFDALPQVYQRLQDDITAMFEGDPAAKSRSEVIRTYPGFYAIAAYRIAHELQRLGVPGVPRIITEHAHSKTGIDIHPSARIGNHFCIDHGTGIVIGETTVIGNHVKLYQGVTLGALSVNKEDAERKRHPTLEDNVVVYAGATILGGETVIGHDSTIGGNVWLTKSVPPHSKIYYQAKMFNGEAEQIDHVIYRQDKK